jgi:PhnB protein
MKSVNPYLNFAGNTEEAFEFYRSVFGGEFAALMRFRDFGDNSMGIAEADLDKVAHIALPLGTGMLMGTDVVESFPRRLEMGNNFFITIEPESAAEADRLFERLSAGGEVLMELQRTAWAEKHGSFVDRYGVQWMVDFAGSVTFAPTAGA